MNIDKAIEILEDMRNININYYSPDRKGALELGIEALKRYKVIRANFGKLRQDQLPGETKD